jgi:hypothetical protein
MKPRRFLLVSAFILASFLGPVLAHRADLHKYYPKAKPYTLVTCLVTDQMLGSRGKPVAFTHNHQQIKVCCKDCRSEFKKDPSKYLRKLYPAK